VRYSGSPLRYSFSEAAHVKSVSLVDIGDGPDGLVTVTDAPIDQPRAMADLSGTLAELTAESRRLRHADDWLRVTVTDPDRPEQLYDRVKAAFPHALQVFHAPAGAEDVGRHAASAATELSARQLAGDFVSHVTGLQADSASIELFEAAYQASLAETGVAS